MRNFVIACLVAMPMIAGAFEPAHAEATRTQHQEWVRKLETPGGTLPYLIEMEAEPADQAAMAPNGTTMQHRSWIKKLETPGGTLGTSL